MVTELITTAEEMSNTNWMAEWNTLGNNSSRQPMSSENLFRMRPAGLVSKNKTGALRTLSTILSWRRSDEVEETWKKR